VDERELSEPGIFRKEQNLTQEDMTELLERLKRLLAEDPTLAARLAAITGDGNVVGDHNVATVNRLSAGDYAIQIGQLHLTLSPDQLRSLPVSAYTASPLPAASTELPRRLRVFLCHASGDKPAVRDLYHRLRADGFDPWLDEENLLPGQDWQLEIPKAVRSSDAVIICLSSRAITKAGYVQKEIKYALDVADEQPEGAIFLIPLRLEECEAPERLRRWQWVDLFQETGYERLLRALRARAESLGLGRPAWEPEMVLISAGEFLMGSDPKKDKNAQDDEFPQHTLYLPDYYIARTPVTNAQYAAFVQAASHNLPKHWGSGKPPEGKEDHPVVYVSWQDAVAYSNWLSQVTGKPYRLPSEAEWEKGARGTDGRVYPWGDEPLDEGRCNFGGNVGGTTPVGRYSPQGDSPYGCTDMAGNVWDWTRSLWGKDWHTPDFGYPYSPGDGREDLKASADIRRVVRGGSWDNIQRNARCAYRYRYIPDDFYGSVGLRVVVSLALPSSES
jgi:formylglycine-generating enzyme required for sulfatase activity